MASNWQQLKRKLSVESAEPSSGASSKSAALKRGPGNAAAAGEGKKSVKRRRLDLNEAVEKQQGKLKGAAAEPEASVEAAKGSGPVVKFSHARLGEKMKAKYVGLDCEMVGTGFGGKQSILARCCMVNFDGEVIYDSFVKPQGFVTDFRTQWSGVRAKDLFGKQQENIVSFAECQAHVAAAIKNKVLLGHGLKNDLDALQLSHPRSLTRDTTRYRPYMRKHRNDKYRPRALRELSKDFLKTVIQTGEHDPGEDARAAVNLYRLQMDEWEAELRNKKAAIRERARGGVTQTKAGAGAGEETSASIATSSSTTTTSTITTTTSSSSSSSHKRPKGGVAAGSSMFGAAAGGAKAAKMRSVSDVDKVRGKKGT